MNKLKTCQRHYDADGAALDDDGDGNGPDGDGADDTVVM